MFSNKSLQVFICTCSHHFSTSDKSLSTGDNLQNLLLERWNFTSAHVLQMSSQITHTTFQTLSTQKSNVLLLQATVKSVINQDKPTQEYCAFKYKH